MAFADAVFDGRNNLQGIDAVLAERSPRSHAGSLLPANSQSSRYNFAAVLMKFSGTGSLWLGTSGTAPLASAARTTSASFCSAS